MSCKNLIEIQQLTNLKQTYLITVAILEGRYYVWPNMDSVVIVQALGKKEKTAVVKKSDCPYYNEYFTFDKKIALHDLLNSEVVVTVVQPKTCFRRRKILGWFRLDVATIWAEPEHQFYHKWAVLNAPTNKEGCGSRGFLKVNLTVITKNVSPALPPVQEDNEIEDNLLLPHSRVLERFRAKFEFDIFRAEHLYDKKKPPSSHVFVAFGGNTAKTSVRKNTSFPVFNERIVIHDMFPVLCQRIHVKIFFGSTLYASDFLPLNYVTSEDEDGIFPKFGPAFLHMYDSAGMEEYKGSILFSMRTKAEVVSAEDKKKSEVISISASSGVYLPQIDLKFLLIIFESSALDKRFEGKIYYKVTIGNTDKEEENRDSQYSTNKYITDKIEVKKINRNSSYSVIKESKPLLTLSLSVMDFRKRLYNMNMLEKVYDDMEKRLINIGFLFAEGDITLNQQISDELSQCLDSFRSSAQKYIDIAGNYDLSTLTELGKGKFEQNLKLMKHLIEKAQKIFNPNALRKSFMKSKRLCDRILCIFNNINDMWPDIFITALKESKKLAYVRISCKDVLHSSIEEEKGKMCGVVTTLFLQPEKKKTPKAKFFTNSVGKMEVILWLGLEKSYVEFLKNLPGAFEMSDNAAASPHLYVTTKEEHVFQCRCHLFQGRIRPGNDASALSDTIVRIHFGDDCQESKIEPETLNPVWNQTLIFKKVNLFGSTSFIQQYPPSIIVELLDRDRMFFWEFIGRTMVKPVVKTRDEPYAPPKFPPKLRWYKVFDNDSISAEILAAFEMLEITGDSGEREEEAEKDIIRIPDDIKPELITFRMEIYFWGLRNVKRSKVGGIKRPKINIECVKTMIYSEPLKDTKNDSNFGNPMTNIDLQLPSMIEYASPLIIRMMDSQLGFKSFVGVYIKHVKFFLFHPLTKEERQNIFTGATPHESLVDINVSEKSSEDSEVNLKDSQHHMVFNPQNCFCRTSELQKVPKKISQIRCICQKTRWQKFRQAFTKKKIYCPCLKEYQKSVTKVEKKHRKTCACCRKVLEKLHLVTSDHENKVGFWAALRGIFTSSCFGGKCECCRKVCEKVGQICRGTTNRCPFCKKIGQKFSKKKKGEEESFDDSYEDNDYDWWTKYYSSLKPEPKAAERISVRDKLRLTIYSRELESQPEFEHFKDLLMSFPMYKGKRTGDEVVDRDMIQGVFKGNIKIYRWPEPPGKQLITRNGSPLADGYFRNFPPNQPLHFTVRVYCVRALHLPPKDANGKCDPYLFIKLGNQIHDDKDNHKNKDLNPIFGRLFEFNGVFPKDHSLVVQVWDRDVATRDDLIGETTIDIENRLYTNHRAKCGIPEFYKETGYCAWRDQLRPSAIVSRLCKHWNLPKPIYAATSVQICSKVFESPQYESSGDDRIDREIKALYALRNWHQVPFAGLKLVPEHVETRSLYCPDKALVEQGKIQLWIDIFPAGDLPPPKPVDITVKPPGDYELRVVIWNTADVLLQEDEFFTGQKKSDIFVKGMVLGQDDTQSTDVHYRSLTGEGNFNWRFVFPMQYLMNEDMTLVRRKEGHFQSRDSDKKFPCRLILQVWENDTFSKDDFLGTLSLDLSRMPRGSKGPEKCNLSIIEPNVPRLNLFKTKRTRGWWPFKGNDLDGNLTLVGKVEAELELMTAEEAQQKPAGLGRSAPQGLPEPKRPKTSFNWFTNPLKSLRFIIFKHYKWKILKACCCIMLMVFTGLGIYALPGYAVKRFLGA